MTFKLWRLVGFDDNEILLMEGSTYFSYVPSMYDRSTLIIIIHGDSSQKARTLVGAMLRYLRIRQLVPQTGTGVAAKYPRFSDYFNI